MVFPVTKVKPEQDSIEDNGAAPYTPKNEFDKWCYEHYDALKQRDAPVCLQLVAKRFEDEKLVEAFMEINDKVGLPFVDCLA